MKEIKNTIIVAVGMGSHLSSFIDDRLKCLPKIGANTIEGLQFKVL